jgi:hypothetical protein
MSTEQKIAIACTNANGEADMTIVTVTATAEEIENSVHYERAIEQAEEEGYSQPFVCFDQYEQANIKRVLPELFGETL